MRDKKTYAAVLLSLMSSSHAISSHQGMTTIHLSSSVGTISFQSVIALRRESYSALARLNISDWIVSRRAGMVEAMSERDGGFGTGVAADGEGLLLLEIGGADFETEGDALI
jgi:hypothetical protein